MSSNHTHATEEQLIELALAGSSAGEVSSCDACHARLEDLRGFLDTCRADLQPQAGESAAEPSGFVERVLGSTTREDLGWRGDLRLVGAFVGRQLRSSRALRFAAASLAVHLLVLPVVAWMVLQEVREERTLTIRIEAPREQALPAVPIEPDLELEAPDPGPEPELVEGPEPALDDPLLREESQREESQREESQRVAALHRSFLRAGSAPAPASLPGGDSTLAQLFLARSAGLHAGGLRAELPADFPPAAPGLERALLAEVLLDAWLLEGRSSARLQVVLAELGRDPGVPALERRLECLSLSRASSYGLLDPAQRVRMHALEDELQVPRRSAESTYWSTWSSLLQLSLESRSVEDRVAAGDWPAWARR